MYLKQPSSLFRALTNCFITPNWMQWGGRTTLQGAKRLGSAIFLNRRPDCLEAASFSGSSDEIVCYTVPLVHEACIFSVSRLFRQ
jgi:hypothetical protein